jgi:hypothetical protein
MVINHKLNGVSHFWTSPSANPIPSATKAPRPAGLAIGLRHPDCAVLLTPRLVPQRSSYSLNCDTCSIRCVFHYNMRPKRFHIWETLTGRKMVSARALGSLLYVAAQKQVLSPCRQGVLGQQLVTKSGPATQITPESSVRQHVQGWPSPKMSASQMPIQV